MPPEYQALHRVHRLIPRRERMEGRRERRSIGLLRARMHLAAASTGLRIASADSHTAVRDIASHAPRQLPSVSDIAQHAHRQRDASRVPVLRMCRWHAAIRRSVSTKHGAADESAASEKQTGSEKRPFPRPLRPNQDQDPASAAAPTGGAITVRASGSPEQAVASQYRTWRRRGIGDRRPYRVGDSPFSTAFLLWEERNLRMAVMCSVRPVLLPTFSSVPDPPAQYRSRCARGQVETAMAALDCRCR
eukprot:3903317-Rhodomonas_salina.1